MYHDEAAAEVHARKSGYVVAQADLMKKQLEWTWFGVDKPENNTDVGSSYTPDLRGRVRVRLHRPSGSPVY